MTTFVDSTVWFAAAVARDRNNGLAKSILASLDGWTLTGHVLTETSQLLSARFGREVADTFWGRLRESGAVVEPVTASDLEAASRIEASYPDEEFSLVDRTSFAVMERLGITQAASFSSSFAAYRYGVRKKPFRIVRSGHSAAFAALRQAMLERTPVRLNYSGKELEVCPYILGHAVGEERAFALELGSVGKKRSGEPNWVCLRIQAVQDVRPVDRAWTAALYPGRIQRCVDQVHLDATRREDHRRGEDQGDS